MRRRWWPAGVALIVAALGLVAGSPLVAVVGPLIAVLVPRIRDRYRQRRQQRNDRDALAAFVDRIQQQLRSGAPLGPALRADPYWPPPTLDGRRPPDLELVTVALQVLSSRGGAALHSLDRLGDALRARRAVDDESRAQAAQAAASATLLAVLPAVVGLGLALIEPKLASFYLTEPLGALCAAVGIAGSYLSWSLIEHLTWRAP